MTSTRTTAQTFRLTAAALFATTLLVTALTGCTAAHRNLFPDKPAAVHSSVTATPTPVGPTAASITVGQELTAAETSALKKDFEALEKAGKVIYTTSDGKNIVVGLKEPVPAAVAADASAKVAAGAAVSAQSSDGNGALGGAIKTSSTIRSRGLLAYDQAVTEINTDQIKDQLTRRPDLLLPAHGARSDRPQPASKQASYLAFSTAISTDI